MSATKTANRMCHFETSVLVSPKMCLWGRVQAGRLWLGPGEDARNRKAKS